jgi:hypothetical protein
VGIANVGISNRAWEYMAGRTELRLRAAAPSPTVGQAVSEKTLGLGVDGSFRRWTLPEENRSRDGCPHAKVFQGNLIMGVEDGRRKTYMVHVLILSVLGRQRSRVGRVAEWCGGRWQTPASDRNLRRRIREESKTRGIATVLGARIVCIGTCRSSSKRHSYAASRRKDARTGARMPERAL